MTHQEVVYVYVPVVVDMTDWPPGEVKAPPAAVLMEAQRFVDTVVLDGKGLYFDLASQFRAVRAMSGIKDLPGTKSGAAVKLKTLMVRAQQLDELAAQTAGNTN
jgi:hypothetical protein